MFCPFDRLVFCFALSQTLQQLIVVFFGFFYDLSIYVFVEIHCNVTVQNIWLYV